jgi:hypothetical protein
VIRLVGNVGGHYGGTFGQDAVLDLTIADLELYELGARLQPKKTR